MSIHFYNEMTLRISITHVYVDDLNIIRTPEQLLKKIEYLKKELDMKVLRKTKFCLGLQIEHLADCEIHF